MTEIKLNHIAVTVAGAIIFLLLPNRAYADEFGKIVHQIETTYHVHHNYSFLMGFTRVMVKCTGGFAGVKGFKIALFEDQHLSSSSPDSDLDDVIQSAGDQGWRPLVKSYSRHSREHSYIYARQEGKDLKMLIVSVEPSEAVVIQVKVNPDKLAKFIEQNEGVRETRAALR
jgi:hypothetical protein